MTKSDNKPSIRMVIFNRPGPAWQQDVEPMHQIGVLDHVKYLAQLEQEGKIEYSGPFLSGGIGGMVLASSDITLEDAHSMANADPTVISGLFEIEIRQWLANKN
jgi:uncharacterized protein YciI